MTKAKKTEKAPPKTKAVAAAKEAEQDVLKVFEELPEEEKATEDTFYVVNDSDEPVRLEIFVNAPGQTCNSRIELDDVVIKETHNGSFEEQPLEKNAKLVGQTLFIATTVTNTAGQKRKAKASIRLKGGQMPAEDVLAKTLDAGESVTFKYTCKFFKARQ